MKFAYHQKCGKDAGERGVFPMDCTGIRPSKAPSIESLQKENNLLRGQLSDMKHEVSELHAGMAQVMRAAAATERLPVLSGC